MEQTTKKAEQNQLEADKNHQNELKKMQDKLVDLVRTIIENDSWFHGENITKLDSDHFQIALYSDRKSN